MKEFFKKKWVKRTLILLALLVLVLILVGGNDNTTTLRTDKVERGNVEVSVSGNGTLSSSSARTEISKVSTKVEKINYLEGDIVKKGYIIAELDDKDYKVTVDAQRNSIKQAELSKKNIDRQIKALEVKAPVSGYVSNLNIQENTYVGNTMQLCSIVSQNKYEITLQFVSSDANPILLNNKARVMLVNTMNYIDGEVTFVGNRKSMVDGGVQVIDVIITVEHPTYSLENVYAKAEVETLNKTIITSVNQSQFRPVSGANVISETMGTVKTIYAKNGQYVGAGETIMLLENQDLVLNSQNAALSLQNAYEQLRYAESKLNDYKVIAQMDGKITKLDLKEGDYVSPGTPLATVSDENTLELKIPVDELDIAKINYDNKVLVSIDAMPETEKNPIEGKITKLPLEGITSGGVTDYYVTVSIEGKENIRISMNATAKILIEKAENVLYIPIEALIKEDDKTFVEVKNSDGTVERRSVVVGISDVSNIEIKEGVQEGEDVVVPEVAGSTFNFMTGE